MHQHLVHDHLEKQRGDQRKDLQCERRDECLRQQAPVLHDGGNEPGEIEAGEGASQLGAGGDQDGAAGKTGRQFIQGQQYRPFRLRVVNQRLVALDPRQYQKLGGSAVVVVRFEDAGKRAFAKAPDPLRCCFEAGRFRLQGQTACCTDQIIGRDRRAAEAALMMDLLGIGRASEKSGDQCKAFQATEAWLRADGGCGGMTRSVWLIHEVISSFFDALRMR